MTQPTFGSCPHLGLNEDRSSVYMQPTPAHRCFAKHTTFLPDEAYQTNFCLGGNHKACAFYVSAPANPGRHLEQDELFQAPKKRRGRLSIVWTILSSLIVFALLAVIYLNSAINSDELSIEEATVQGDSTRINTILIDTPEPTTDDVVQPEPTATPLVPTPVPAENVITADTPTPPGAQEETTSITLNPADVLMWISNDTRRNYRNDSALFAGVYGGQTYISAIRFDLSKIGTKYRGADLLDTQLQLTGLRDERLPATTSSIWKFQLIAEKDLEELYSSDFLQAFSAPASISLNPDLTRNDLASGNTNSWTLDNFSREWLRKQILDQAGSVIVRILVSGTNEEALFAWDSGVGIQSRGDAPRLTFTFGPPPTQAPPTPTPIFIVATLTPTPVDPIAAAAATRTAQANGENITSAISTPFVQIFTPTPVHQNVETALAAAYLQNLPPVIAHTPQPQNEATALADSLYATAVAETTGTFTPLPEEYVTPIFITPTPSPGNIATQVARLELAKANDQSAVVIPELGHNVVVIEYVIATSTAENIATAIAVETLRAAEAEFLGQATRLPPHVRVITQTPTPLPTWTPTLPPIITSGPTATPTLTPTPPAGIPSQFINKIVFLSDRTGTEKVHIFDPQTGQVAEVTLPWLYQMAREQLGQSPDGKRRAIVARDESRGQTLQVQVYNSEFNTQRTVSPFREVSYDPAWSPTGALIAFVAIEAGNDEIYVTDPEGNGVKRLTFTEGVWEKHPTWRPDGQKIIFVSNRTGHNQLWQMNPDGSDQQILLDSPFNDKDPVWIR